MDHKWLKLKCQKIIEVFSTDTKAEINFSEQHQSSSPNQNTNKKAQMQHKRA
jgi:hypothetical protein